MVRIVNIHQQCRFDFFFDPVLTGCDLCQQHMAFVGALLLYAGWGEVNEVTPLKNNVVEAREAAAVLVKKYPTVLELMGDPCPPPEAMGECHLGHATSEDGAVS